MNDRFRFRVWSIREKEMIYNAEIAYDGTNYPTEWQLGENNNDGWIYCFGEYIDRKEDYKVMQCTGLKDKNGRLIYEGDILDFDLSIPKNGGHYRGIVYWQNQNNLIGWMISSLKHTWSWDIRQIAHPNDWMTWAEIIGNIHENPELLEDK